MSGMGRVVALRVADVMGAGWRLLPGRLRETLITGLYVLESRGDTKQGMKRLFTLEDRLRWVISERAMAYEGGIHPKHRLTRYHDFFVDNIAPGSRVLDIGCGYGAVARSIASRVPGSVVVGVDRNSPRLEQARRASAGLANLAFIEADARKNLPAGPWNVVVLSNILEHIDDRVDFLKDILAQARPSRVLIRVPCFERDWTMAMRKEIGFNYFSDAEHFIEPTVAELTAEVTQAGLRPLATTTPWGEIWMVCEPGNGAVS